MLHALGETVDGAIQLAISRLEGCGRALMRDRVRIDSFLEGGMKFIELGQLGIQLFPSMLIVQ